MRSCRVYAGLEHTQKYNTPNTAVWVVPSPPATSLKDTPESPFTPKSFDAEFDAVAEESFADLENA